MVIIGSVAVNPANGARLGKGEGRRAGPKLMKLLLLLRKAPEESCCRCCAFFFILVGLKLVHHTSLHLAASHGKLTPRKQKQTS